MYLPLTLVSFIIFLASLFVFIWRGCDRDGRLRPAAPFIIVITLVSLGTWLYALPRVPPPYDLNDLKNYPVAK